MNKKHLEHFFQYLGYEFKNSQLLAQALTHRSIEGPDNERLEFLGDSIVNFIIAEALFLKFHRAKEGQLSHLRSRLVDRKSLADIARQLHVSDYLKLGPGELKTGGHKRESILADAMEAIIAAIYLDSGMESVKQCVLKWYEERLDNIQPKENYKDAKTLLQEYLQAKQLNLPKYKVLKIAGEAHAQVFHVECTIPGFEKCAQGSGTNRRSAEQQAALHLLELIKNEG